MSDYGLQYMVINSQAEDYNPETYQEIKWRVILNIFDNDGIKSAYDIEVGSYLYADLTTESGGTIDIGRYKITSIESVNGFDSLEVLIEWKNFLFPDGGYAPGLYVTGPLGTISKYGSLFLPDRDTYGFDANAYNKWNNFNDICTAYYIDSNMPQKLGKISEPLTFNSEEPNIFKLSKVPVADTIILEVNCIDYKDYPYINYNPNTLSIEWLFTKDKGGFNLDNIGDIKALYNYISA